MSKEKCKTRTKKKEQKFSPTNNVGDDVKWRKTVRICNALQKANDFPLLFSAKTKKQLVH